MREMMFRLQKTMLFSNDVEEMENPYLIESVNTGSQWRLEEYELRRFFAGRNKKFYRVFKCQK